MKQFVIFIALLIIASYFSGCFGGDIESDEVDEILLPETTN